MTRKTTYDYQDADGNVRFRVVRSDNDDGAKTFVQAHRDNIESEWVYKAPSWPRPIYNLPEILRFPNATVLVVEGEKTAIAARQYLPEGWVVTTWSGGTSAVKQTDWSSIGDRRVVVWPDIDQITKDGQLLPWPMQPGSKAAAAVAAATGGAIVDVPDIFIEASTWVTSSGWDLADELPAGVTAEAIRAMLLDAAKRATPEPPAPLPKPVPAKSQENATRHAVTEINNEIEFIVDGKGRPKPIYENVIRLLTHTNQFNLRYDDFAMRPCFGDALLEDRHLRMICRWVQGEGIPAGTSVIQEAIVAAAETRRFHPVKQYLDALAWDGVARLDTLLVKHARVANTEIHRAMTGKWFVQAVARIYQPGCQADAMLILEGEQGQNKSTFFRSIFGSRWFSDHLPDLSSKDALIQLRGLWAIEVAELATLGRSDANRIKQFLTSRVDRYRDPYGRLAMDYPRTCVFAGTVNPGGDGYLKDPTGARRFWPMTVATIDIQAVAEQRDQLWAEAKARYDAGEQWWLPQSLSADASAVQADRYENDPWADKIEEYLIGKNQTTTSDILKSVLDISKAGDWTRADQIRVARILCHENTWVRRKERVGSKTRWAFHRSAVAPTPKEDLFSDEVDDPF